MPRRRRRASANPGDISRRSTGRISVDWEMRARDRPGGGADINPLDLQPRPTMPRSGAAAQPHSLACARARTHARTRTHTSAYTHKYIHKRRGCTIYCCSREYPPRPQISGSTRSAPRRRRHRRRHHPLPFPAADVSAATRGGVRCGIGVGVYSSSARRAELCRASLPLAARAVG